MTEQPAFEVITFDWYGTIIDWELGIRRAFADQARQDGRTIDLDAVVAAYHEIEPKIQAGPYRSYRDVLTETARQIGQRLNWPMSPDRSAFLAESLPDWPPFPDSAGALQRLDDAGYRLGILSNIDDDLLAQTLRHLPDVFDQDWLVTAQQVGSYKPALAHFETARSRLGARSWLHAAQSVFHDIRPASSLGIPSAWINRKREPLSSDGPRPVLLVNTLTELGQKLTNGPITD